RMRATLDCCERAASGQAAAETATIFMNSRRLIAAPEAQTGHRTDLPFSLEGVHYRHDVRFGSKADIRAAKIMSALPPRKRTFSVQTPMSAKGQKRTSQSRRLPTMLIQDMARRPRSRLGPSDRRQDPTVRYR